MDARLKIKVTSKITDAQGATAEMVIFSDATYKAIGDKRYLMYEETEGSGLEGTKTLLSYESGLVRIKRYGDVNSDLVIQLDATHENFYRTPYGIFEMQTSGKSVHWDDNGRLEILMDYQLCLTSDGTCSHVFIEIEEL
ncbi:YwiB family protein [Fusibacter tunisiensis]|uniref:Uncharacterized beta-barrel protein YwiB (DUF1934 family) n=1 Tax=Fusibacter tunisiensis TaxID=1008308 RepID=A0ABS2MNH6_9FIRM|nr:DUF1934 domain-containing protein [Fusibacter tunisiensis]MBM7560954.1 uncharacterized beta-barrel protein YwiB (DUF1934 family) [Fusibacter tunisiensis]